MDVHSPATRSFNMSKIRNSSTKPEMAVRQACRSIGLSYRVNYKGLPGTPDLVFQKLKIAMFVHGCFWHSHSCKWGSVKVSTNSEFWETKRSTTKERDSRNIYDLTKQNWKPIVIWECQTKNFTELRSLLFHTLTTEY